MRRLLVSGVAAITLLAIGGCGALNRVATLNQTTQTPGAATAAAVQQQLAKQGLADAQVTCAKNMIVNVGTRTSCALVGGGAKRIVTFTFTNSHGEIDATSVKAS